MEKWRKFLYQNIKTVGDALERMPDDFDFASNYTDDYAFPTICLPVNLTEEGKREWRDVLRLPVGGIHPTFLSDCAVVIDIDSLPESQADKMERRLYNFCMAIAGYCSEANTEKWFEDDEN